MAKNYRLNNEISLSQDKIIKNLNKSAVLFSSYINKNLLFIFAEKCKGHYIYGCQEAYFKASHFMHLCGFKRGKLNAENFFRKSFDNTIKYSELTFTDNLKSASAKLSVLCDLLKFEHVKLYKIGNKDLTTLNNSFIYAIGTSSAVMGFDKRTFKLPIPTTVLKNDISEYVSNPCSLIAVMCKSADVNNIKYSEIIGVSSSGVAIDSLPECIIRKLDQSIVDLGIIKRSDLIK